jgi:NADPH-dependent 2,4-dienoyl-CoA reductase/sulfur reductase-like enzyme
MQAEADVLVIGGGPSGLSTAGALARLGVRSVVLEQDREIGARWAGRYDRLRLHTVRRFSGLAHHPLPATLPRYVTKDEFARYLRDYAARLELDVRLGQEVILIRRHDERWVVDTSASSWRAQVVVFATGKHDRPVVPPWPGRDDHRGRLVHSSTYGSGSEYEGQDVLVVGLGNTGAEISADLAQSGARRVAVAVRRPPPITRRDIAGIPIQLLGMAGSLLPASVGDRLASAMRRIAIGDLSRYGLGQAHWEPFSARRPPVIDVGFLRELRGGRIEILPAVERLTEDEVVFADGRQERFDAVIAATGFRSGLSDLLEAGLRGDNGGIPASLPAGLHAVGFRESMRGVLFEARRDSIELARVISRELGHHDRGLPRVKTRVGPRGG